MVIVVLASFLVVLVLVLISTESVICQNHICFLCELIAVRDRDARDVSLNDVLDVGGVLLENALLVLRVRVAGRGSFCIFDEQLGTITTHHVVSWLQTYWDIALKFRLVIIDVNNGDRVHVTQADVKRLFFGRKGESSWRRAGNSAQAVGTKQEGFVHAIGCCINYRYGVAVCVC